MEVWDLYTKYRELTGREHIRGRELPEGYFHLVVHVWIRNSKGEYLISQRAADRPTYPLMWECVGGSVIKGETSLEGAVRETKEEVGIDLEPEQGRLLFTKIRGKIGEKVCNDIMDVWLFHYDGQVKLENATTKEVAQSRWMTEGEVKRLFDAGRLVPTLNYFFCAWKDREPDDIRYKNVIGRTVCGIIDRPMGSRHPKDKDIIYPVNYGYVENVIGGDGEEQDVYLLGADGPVKEFTGRVIAVYRRYDGNEDKWIVSADEKDYSDEQILGEIFFQEQFFYGKLYR